MSNVIWASVADGSFGGCDADDLIVIRESDMTPEEQSEYWDADGDELDIIVRIAERVNGQRAAVAAISEVDMDGRGLNTWVATVTNRADPFIGEYVTLGSAVDAIRQEGISTVTLHLYVEGAE